MPKFLVSFNTADTFNVQTKLEQSFRPFLSGLVFIWAQILSHQIVLMVLSFSLSLVLCHYLSISLSFFPFYLSIFLSLFHCLEITFDLSKILIILRASFVREVQISFLFFFVDEFFSLNANCSIGARYGIAEVTFTKVLKNICKIYLYFVMEISIKKPWI